jgi:DNA topoisomerase-1
LGGTRTPSPPFSLKGQSVQTDHSPAIPDPKETAAAAGLRYVSDSAPGIHRRKAGTGFTYVDAQGAKVTDAETLRRIKSLVIPPAWTDVWICASENGHIQAVGRDAKGRKQYRYHPRFREIRDTTKYEHLAEFAHALPAIRKTVKQHIARHGLPREKVLATVVHLLETTLIRVGNGDYARQNNSYGLTTLKNRHVAVERDEVRFRFTGKSGKQWTLKLQDRRIAKIIRACQELPGQDLLQYVDDNGDVQQISSQDVNDYLRQISGRDITAKDFRTWAGTVLAAMALAEMRTFDSAAEAKRNVRAAIETVAARLGNTPTICRKCYVHPDIFSNYLDGNLIRSVKSKVESELRQKLAGLRPEEAAVLALLRARLGREVSKVQRSPDQNGARRRGTRKVSANRDSNAQKARRAA